MRSVMTSDGRTLTVREGGDPEGFPVLFISGTPGSSTIYEPHARDAAERGIRLFSYDRPGYGDSTRHKGRKVADCAPDIAAVCDALGVERFCVWGISGGGPHALAAAALMPDRVIAAAALASVAPYDAEGLDFLEGMGEQNVEEFGVIFEGEDAHRASMEKQRRELLSATPEQLVELWQTLLGPSDREVATGVLAAFLLDHIRAGIESKRRRLDRRRPRLRHAVGIRARLDPRAGPTVARRAGQVRSVRARSLARRADPGSRRPANRRRRPPHALRAPGPRGPRLAAGARHTQRRAIPPRSSPSSSALR